MSLFLVQTNGGANHGTAGFQEKNAQGTKPTRLTQCRNGDNKEAFVTVFKGQSLNAPTDEEIKNKQARTLVRPTGNHAVRHEQSFEYVLDDVFGLSNGQTIGKFVRLKCL